MNGLTEGLAIVEMNTGHIEAIAVIERLCFSSPWSQNALREELNNPLAAFFTAELDGRPVGYAGMIAVVDEGYIANIAVHPDYRRRGIATALLGRLSSFALEKGLAMLTLEVRQSNKAAIKIYENFGFAQMGVRRGFYENPQEDALIMTKYFTKDG